MNQTFNVYCDESCHLENDHQRVMVLGALWCPLEKVREVTMRLHEIKAAHGLPRDFEVKWTKVSPAKHDFYLALLDYFFDDDDLHFRALIIPDKSQLRHADFGHLHDDWYYKMYFNLLKVILDPQDHYRVYLDVKDTLSARKVAKLHEVLANANWDFERAIVERVQTVRSHEVAPLQLADLLIGAVAYANRHLQTSDTKFALIRRMQARSRYNLTQTTLYKESKVNLFVWHASEGA